MTLKSIVFDLDGTLVDSSPDIAAALNAAFADLGVRELSAPEVLAMLGGGPRILVAQALTSLGVTLDDATLDARVESYSAHYRAAPAARTVCFADAAKALPELHAKGIKLGICTNKRTDIADQVLTHLGLREVFGAVIGSDLASAPKPNPAHLLETLQILDTDPSDCIYVGDTSIDAAAAAGAGVRYVHVSWGHQLESPVQQIVSFAELADTAAAVAPTISPVSGPSSR